MRAQLPNWIIALALLGGGLWAGALGNAQITGAASVIDRVETVLLDLRILIVGHRAPPVDVVIVAIDDETVARAGHYPIDREHLARLVEEIRKAGARALAIDILLVESSETSGDQALVDALEALPTVIAAAGHFEGKSSTASFVPVVTDQLRPASEFATASAVGLVNVATDSGGTPRHTPLLFMTADGLQPSFALRAAGLHFEVTPVVTSRGVRFGERTQPLDLGWHLPLNYYGPRGTIRTVSARTFLDERAHKPDLSGRIVILGVSATAVGDRFNTPFDSVLPGVEVQATGIANLLDGSPLVRDAHIRFLDAAVAMTLTLVGILALVFLPLATASVLFLLLLTGWLGVTTALLYQGYWLSGGLPLAASLPPVVCLIIARQVADRTQTRRHIRAHEALGRFQSPQLARRIADDPDFLLTPREQAAAILFIDLSGYTGLSERLGPVKTRNFLKEFHTLVANETARGQGVVLDFMGDGAMVGFGIPDSSPMDAVRAFRSAFHLERAVTDWIADTGMEEQINLVRVGAHFGPVVLSRLGHDFQQQIAATGDSVNVASRLLDVAKAQQVSIVVSSELIDAVRSVTGEQPLVPNVEIVAIRGRQKGMRVGLWTSGENASNLPVMT